MRDSHMHTPLCKHAGDANPVEYARCALEREHPLEGITFTCHNPPFEAPNGEWSPQARMSRGEYAGYLELIRSTSRQFADRLEILTGLEVDFIPDSRVIDELRALLSEHPLDWILGSVHPFLPQYQFLYAQGASVTAENLRFFQSTYFEHLAIAAETTMGDGSPMFDALAHPDIVRVVRPLEWAPSGILEDIIEPALDRIGATGVAMEVNTSGLLKRPSEIHPNVEILKAIGARKIPIVLGSDAHSPERVGDAFEQALSLVVQADIEAIVVPVGGRQYETLALQEAAERIGAKI